MLMRSTVEIFEPRAETNCDACGRTAAVIQIDGDAKNNNRRKLCPALCAPQEACCDY